MTEGTPFILLAEEEGRKDDAGKLRWDLLPRSTEELIKAMTLGVQKYGAWNWAKGLAYSRCVAAMFRHFYAWWWRRESVDSESGAHHLAVVAMYALWLVDYEQAGTGADDRPYTPTVSAHDRRSIPQR